MNPHPTPPRPRPALFLGIQDGGMWSALEDDAAAASLPLPPNSRVLFIKVCPVTASRWDMELRLLDEEPPSFTALESFFYILVCADSLKWHKWSSPHAVGLVASNTSSKHNHKKRVYILLTKPHYDIYLSEKNENLHFIINNFILVESSCFIPHVGIVINQIYVCSWFSVFLCSNTTRRTDNGVFTQVV